MSNWFDKLVNSRFWYVVYYRHTRKHKSDLQRTKDDVLKKRKELINK